MLKNRQKAKAAREQKIKDQAEIDMIQRLVKEGAIGGEIDFQEFKKIMKEDVNLAEELRRAFVDDQKETVDGKSGVMRGLLEVASDLAKNISGYFSQQSHLATLQKRCVEMYEDDVLIGAAGETVSLFSVGSGISFSTGNDKVNEYLEDVWGTFGTDMVERQEAISLYLYLTSEFHMVYDLRNKDKKRKIPSGREVPDIDTFKIEPWEVDVHVALPNTEKVLLIEHKPTRGSTASKFYTTLRRYLLDDKEPVLTKNKTQVKVEADYIVQYMRGSRGTQLRGAPVPRRALRWATIAREIILDTASKYHEWSKVIYKLMVKGRTFKPGQDTALQAPAGASVLVEHENALWEAMETEMDASGMKAVWSMIMYYTAAALRIPYQALLFDFSDSDYASSRQGDKPLNQFIEYHQKQLKREFNLFFQLMLKLGVDLGILEKQSEVSSVTEASLITALPAVREVLILEGDPAIRMPQILSILEKVADKKKVDTVSLDIVQVFPETAGETLLNKARAIELFDRAGIASKQTLAELAGFTWVIEIARMLSFAEFGAMLADKALANSDGGGNPDLMPDNKERGIGSTHPRSDEGETAGDNKFGNESVEEE